MSVKKVVFAGCSLTAGTGWDPANIKETVPTYPGLWVNLCYQNIPKLSQYELVNIGAGGASNSEIFINVTNSLAAYGNNIETLFVQWTAWPRYNFNTGFETWPTVEKLHNRNRNNHDILLRDGTRISRNQIRTLLDKLSSLHHPHWEILNVVKFSNIIKSLAEQVGINNVFFINGLCGWDQNYFVKLDNALPHQYSDFTRYNILEVQHRPNNEQEIIALYNLAHQQYQDAGGINLSNWLNIYNSLFQNKIDVNFDNLHPGTKSNQLYFKIIYSGLQSLGYI